MKCKNCEKEIGNECRFCPHCGVETEPAPQEESIPISSNPVDLSENTAPAPPPQPDNPSVGVTQQSSANAVNLPFYKHWKIWAIVSGVLFLLLIAVSVLQPSAPSPRNDALVSTEAASSPVPQASAAAKSKATAAPTSAATPPSTGFSRKAPAPINTPVQFQYNGATSFSAEMQLTEVLRGEAAWNKIYAENQFNSKPNDGYEYVLVKVAIQVSSVEDDKALVLSDFDFKAFSGTNEELPSNAVVLPEPKFEGKLYAEGSKEGYIAVQVEKDDPSPKLAYKLSLDGSSGIWFSLS